MDLKWGKKGQPLPELPELIESKREREDFHSQAAHLCKTLKMFPSELESNSWEKRQIPLRESMHAEFRMTMQYSIQHVIQEKLGVLAGPELSYLFCIHYFLQDSLYYSVRRNMSINKGRVRGIIFMLKTLNNRKKSPFSWIKICQSSPGSLNWLICWHFSSWLLFFFLLKHSLWRKVGSSNKTANFLGKKITFSYIVSSVFQWSGKPYPHKNVIVKSYQDLLKMFGSFVVKNHRMILKGVLRMDMQQIHPLAENGAGEENDHRKTKHQIFNSGWPASHYQTVKKQGSSSNKHIVLSINKKGSTRSQDAVAVGKSLLLYIKKAFVLIVSSHWT